MNEVADLRAEIERLKILADPSLGYQLQQTRGALEAAQGRYSTLQGRFEAAQKSQQVAFHMSIFAEKEAAGMAARVAAHQALRRASAELEAIQRDDWAQRVKAAIEAQIDATNIMLALTSRHTDARLASLRTAITQRDGTITQLVNQGREAGDVIEAYLLSNRSLANQLEEVQGQLEEAKAQARAEGLSKGAVISSLQREIEALKRAVGTGGGAGTRPRVPQPARSTRGEGSSHPSVIGGSTSSHASSSSSLSFEFDEEEDEGEVAQGRGRGEGDAKAPLPAKEKKTVVRASKKKKVAAKGGEGGGADAGSKSSSTLTHPPPPPPGTEKGGAKTGGRLKKMARAAPDTDSETDEDGDATYEPPSTKRKKAKQ